MLNITPVHQPPGLVSCIVILFPLNIKISNKSSKNPKDTIGICGWLLDSFLMVLLMCTISGCFWIQSRFGAIKYVLYCLDRTPLIAPYLLCMVDGLPFWIWALPCFRENLYSRKQRGYFVRYNSVPEVMGELRSPTYHVGNVGYLQHSFEYMWGKKSHNPVMLLIQFTKLPTWGKNHTK